ncbi:WecB/TagA/CpsF family glycosyltransferase [Escherichia coli]
MYNSSLDTKVSNYTDIKHILLNNKKHIMITFVNPYSYTIIDSQTNIIENFDYIFADGALLVYLNNLFEKEKIIRTSFDFSSIANDVFEHAINENKNCFFIGGNTQEIELFIKNIKICYPNLKIVGFHNGFLDSSTKQDLFCTLIESKVDYIIIGMGTPLQENLAIELKEKNIDFECIFTCGGFISQTASKVDYYLPIIKKLGLRWLQRFILHPHVRKRILMDYPRFVLKYIYFKIRKNYFN